MYLVVFYVGEYGVCGCVGVYTKSKSSELSPLRRKLLRNFLLRCARINILFHQTRKGQVGCPFCQCPTSKSCTLGEKADYHWHGQVTRGGQLHRAPQDGRAHRLLGLCPAYLPPDLG
jgi:hypothetical protein